jgi:DNA-binding NarL/FixJ family response regulator
MSNDEVRVTRVMVADDHALVRAGISSLLSAMANVQVVGEAPNGREAVRMARELEPEVVLMDVSMPDLNGLEATTQLLRDRPRTKVVMLSMHTSPEYVFQALQAGAAGYVIKDSTPTELALALAAVQRGETYLSPSVSRHVVSDYVRLAGGNTGPGRPLSPRQREILQLIAEGMTSKEIARKLGLSVKTIETHRTQLMNHLDIHDVAGLVRYAIRTGLVSADK